MRYDIPTFDFPRIMADNLVTYAAFWLVYEPLAAILSGTLWGPEAFVGGAIIVATVLFFTAYFADEFEDAL